MLDSIVKNTKYLDVYGRLATERIVTDMESSGVLVPQASVRT